MKIIIALAALLLTTSNVFAGSTLDRFIQKYHALTSVSCEFRDAHGLVGSVQAKKGGSYRISLPDRTIVCNGSIVWSATPSSKTVIINAYRATTMDLSIERVFFTLMNVYRPTVTKDFDGGKVAVIKLTPPAENAMVGSVKSVEIEVDASMQAKRIIVKEEAATTTWTLHNVKLNGKIAAGMFVYTTPAGWQVVDLR
ncbi:MAG: hypothetical protein JSS89_00185 [Bacteroidetes bacterium]|nr:hypothetical protein [Bacteroidota bacterium]